MTGEGGREKCMKERERRKGKMARNDYMMSK